MRCAEAVVDTQRWSDILDVYLTFDVEIWCNGWSELDSRFPDSFERYVFGRSAQGEYALPKTLDVLRNNGLLGVFFVEPLFAARFGIKYLATIVSMLQEEGHEVQMHLHPEWTDEIRPLVFPGACRKRQHLSYYSLDEQKALIRLGRNLLDEAGCRGVSAFRAGSFAANRDTYRALSHCGIRLDSSLNAAHPDSGLDLRGEFDFLERMEIEQVNVLPMTVFRDGIGRLRPAQIGACSFSELRSALETAHENGAEDFVILSHNFEMLKPGKNEPDRVVTRRFEQLCSFLAANSDYYKASRFSEFSNIGKTTHAAKMATSSFLATLRRFGEQAFRKF